MTPLAILSGLLACGSIFGLGFGWALAMAEGCLRLVMRVVTRDNGIDCARSPLSS